MKLHTRVLCTLAMSIGVATWLAGCGGDTKKGAPAKPTGGTQAKPDTHEEHGTGKHEEAGHMEGGHKEGHGHSEADMKAAVAKLASYAEAMHEIDEHREEIEHLIESGKLGEVHPPAEHIARIAQRLPELAQFSGVPHEHWKDINTQSRDLANLFDEIDEAGDDGKKLETAAAFAKMVKLIDSLKTHAPQQEN